MSKRKGSSGRSAGTLPSVDGRSAVRWEDCVGRWLLVGLVGCGAKIEDLAFEEGTSTGTGVLTFSTKVDGPAFVRASLDGDVIGETPASPAADGQIEVLGLPTVKEVELVVVADKGGKEVVSEPLDVQVGPPVRTVIPLQTNIWEPDLACDPGGHVLFSYIGDGSSGVGIIDRDANYVFSVDRPGAEQVARARPGRDGKSILYNYADAAKVDDFAAIVRMDMQGNETSEDADRAGAPRLRRAARRPDGLARLRPARRRGPPQQLGRLG